MAGKRIRQTVAFEGAVLLDLSKCKVFVKNVEILLFTFLWKKVLTLFRQCSIIIKLSQNGRYRPKGKKELKKTWKKFKKVLDKPGGKWYNKQVAAKKATVILENWTTRDEVQSIKNATCERSRNSLNENTTQTKVKKLRARLEGIRRLEHPEGCFNTMISRVWSWLRMNAGGVHNTFKSNGRGASALS